MIRSRCHRGLSLAMAFWLLPIVAGIAAWERYEATPGKASAQEPAATSSDGSKWDFVLFLHPHCPCSRASLNEFQELAYRIRDLPVRKRIAFVRPSGLPEGWERSALWETASTIAGVEVQCDVDGREARRSGATTSGHLIVYDPHGHVAYYGGITRGRGRVGESTSRRTILALLEGIEPEVRAAPVYGCALFDSDE